MKGLEGIKVVELTGYVAAPACPRILGEMGATIYKIEPFSGDEYRTNGPGFGMQKTDIDDPAFDLASMNKEFLSVNLKDPEGAAFVEKLLADADVMVTSFRDNALKKLGLDYEAVHARHPHLVWAQMRGYGEYGPERDSKGFDTTAYGARGGFFASLPQADNFQPINWPAAIGDWNASMALTAGVLGALVRKDRTGEGDKVTVNLYHCALWAMQIMLASTQFGDKWPKSRYNVTCPTNNSYRTKDDVWFMICYGSYDIFYDHVHHKSAFHLIPASCLEASQRSTAAAQDTLNEFTCPRIGIESMKSHFLRTSGEMPKPSLPRTMAVALSNFAS